MNNYDLIIIGAGPAALSASIYASRYKINHLIIGALPGGLMAEAHKICNYPSEIEISGFDLMMKMKVHAEQLGAQILTARVDGVQKVDDAFIIKMVDGAEYKAKTVLLATGTVHRRLGANNEGKFIGHGVSYCATCDAMFYKDKVTAVIGSGNSAMTAALYLADVATKVYMIVRGEELKGEVVWIDGVKNNPKIEIIFKTNVLDLIGEDKLTGIKLDQMHVGKDVLDIDGLFVEIGATPETAMFADLNLELNPAGYINIKNDQATNIAGAYAAGDITTGSNNLRQVITACSEGSIAANSIYQYLRTKK